jgi:hypothetical protein
MADRSARELLFGDGGEDAQAGIALVQHHLGAARPGDSGTPLLSM